MSHTFSQCCIDCIRIRTTNRREHMEATVGVRLRPFYAVERVAAIDRRRGARACTARQSRCAAGQSRFRTLLCDLIADCVS